MSLPALSFSHLLVCSRVASQYLAPSFIFVLLVYLPIQRRVPTSLHIETSSPLSPPSANVFLPDHHRLLPERLHGIRRRVVAADSASGSPERFGRAPHPTLADLADPWLDRILQSVRLASPRLFHRVRSKRQVRFLFLLLYGQRVFPVIPRQFSSERVQCPPIHPCSFPLAPHHQSVLSCAGGSGGWSYRHAMRMVFVGHHWSTHVVAQFSRTGPALTPSQADAPLGRHRWRCKEPGSTLASGTMEPLSSRARKTARKSR